MSKYCIYPAGISPATRNAANNLAQLGFQISDAPSAEVTHVLLDIPSFDAEGNLKSKDPLTSLKNSLSEDVIYIGGNLSDHFRNCWDFLKDPFYLAENSAITAYCAIREAITRLPVTLYACPVLVLGWGRIGKCLAALLRSAGASVCVAVRKETDQATLRALGYDTADIHRIASRLPQFRVIFNTVPAPILSSEQLKACQPDCLKIDLASQKGMQDADVVWARGLPGKYASESSGKLIAQTVLRYLSREEDLI